MKRLTTDHPQNNLESALNLFYAKDGEAWVRGGGPEPDYEDATLFTYIRRAIKAILMPVTGMDDVDNDTLSEIMFDWLQDGPESIPGVIAALYESAWAFAEIRARLKAYEDTGLEPAAVAAQKWIPVAEKIPDDNIPSRSYLCWWPGKTKSVPRGFTQICKYSRTRKCFTFNGRVMAVTHWMPLPEPPKEGE